MKRRFLLIGFLCLFVSSMPCPAKEWRGIFPLKTTRDEVVKSLGEPVKEAGDEYFEVADGRVKFGWTRSDCYTQELISPDEIKSDSLVAQIPFIPKEFLPVEYVRKIEQEMQPDSELFVVYFVDCLKGGSGTFSCSSLSRKYGFGYSHSNSGVSALFYYPTEIEADNLKEKLKSCTEK